MELKYILRILLLISLAGCAAVGVPTTNDPIEKLKWAEDLYNNQGRPLPAESLIREAIDICEKKGDQSCLGRAYLQYGFFFRSPSLAANSATYTKIGFLDKSATLDNRYLKSKEYFEKSVNHFLNTTEYDLIATAYLNLGFAYYFLKEPKSECEPYLKSLEFYKKNIAVNPDAKIVIPNGVSSFPEYIAIQQKRAGCI